MAQTGDGERIEGWRFFTDMNEVFLDELVATQPDLESLRVWITDDVRFGAEDLSFPRN
jgi:hypothetical protein